VTLDQIAAGTVPSRFGPVPAHPALDRLRVVLDETIAPAATITDARGVPASHLAALAATGLFGLAVPRAYGGLGAPPEVVTEACELLAGACPSTYLIASQHMTPIRWILDGGGPLLDLLPALARGELIGGAAYGHVRSWPARRTLSARRTPGGWRFDGVAPWFSGAGLVDVVLLAAVAETERSIVFAVVDLPQPSRIDAVPLDLAAIGGSRTATLRLDDLFVPDERVVRVADVDEWQAGDGLDGPVTAPGAVGLARAAIGYALAHCPDSPALRSLADEVAFIRTLDVGTSSAADAAAIGRDTFYWRARSVNLAVRATNAAIVARGGAALLADDPAQVWARAALFLQVRGLSEPIRAAHFTQLADPHRHTSAEPSPAGPFSGGSHDAHRS
jgi:alkylation response protein AidB-like acyl-CoA dehydrogenase